MKLLKTTEKTDLSKHMKSNNNLQILKLQKEKKHLLK